jgi:hypothetical protein
MLSILPIHLRQEVWLAGSAWRLRRQSRKDEVVCFYIGLAAGKAGSLLRFIDRSAVDKPAEAPASGGRVFFRILSHDLSGGRRTGIEAGSNSGDGT